MTARIVLLVAGLVAATAAHAEIRYTMTHLGYVSNFPATSPADINASGQVAGWSKTTRPSPTEPGYFVDHAFLYKGGVIQDLGSLGGESVGLGINDKGHVVGGSEIPLLPGASGDADWRAFVYRDGVMTTLGTLGGRNSEARAINSAGDVTGYSDTAASVTTLERHAFLYSNGSMVDLGTLGGTISYGTALNDVGQVVGMSSVSSHGFLSRAFVYTNGVMTDLGSLAGPMGGSSASDINNAGQIVGASQFGAGPQSHAFLYDQGAMIDLGTLGGSDSRAAGINALGQIVGSSLVAGDTRHSAFIYDGGAMFDLNDLVDPNTGWQLTSANAINDSGWIVASGYSNGRHAGFLLAPVPEPATYALMLAGLGVIGAVVRRRCSGAIDSVWSVSSGTGSVR